MGVLFVAPRARAQEPPTVTAEEIRAAVDRGLGSEDALIAAQAEEPILRAGSAATADLLAGLRRSSRVRARRCADLLGRIGDRSAIPALEAALRKADDDEPLRLAIARALCRLGSTGGVYPLIRLLESGDATTRLRAHAALRRYTHQDFGFRNDAPGAGRDRAVKDWKRWWAQAAPAFRIIESRVY